MSVTSEEFKQKHNREMELARRELERRSQDVIRIYNPLDHSFRYMRDRFWHTIPAKSYKDVRRFEALHFFKKICDFMIGQQISVKGEELKALREKQFGKQFLDKYEENVQIWDRTPKLNDEDLIQKIKEVVIVGLVEEYGLEEPEPDMRIPDEPMDFRPLHERILGDIDKKVLADTPTEPRTVAPPVDDVEKMLKGEQLEERPLTPLRPALKTKLAEAII